MAKKTMNYRQARFLLTMLEQTSIVAYPVAKRKQVFNIKKQMEGVAEKLQQETTITMLLHGGVEKESQRGGKYFDYPEVPKRENLTDAQYGEKLKTHFEAVSVLKAKLKELSEQPCGVEIERVFDEKEFADLCEKVGNIELADIEDFLVKKKAE